MQSNSPCQHLELQSNTPDRSTRRSGRRSCLAVPMGQVGRPWRHGRVRAHRRHARGHCATRSRVRRRVWSLARELGTLAGHRVIQAHWRLVGSSCRFHCASQCGRALATGRCRTFTPASQSVAPRVRPNPSLEPTSTGLALGPRGSQAYAPPRGPSSNPAASAQLKR